MQQSQPPLWTEPDCPAGQACPHTPRPLWMAVDAACLGHFLPFFISEEGWAPKSLPKRKPSFLKHTWQVLEGLIMFAHHKPRLRGKVHKRHDSRRVN